MDKVFHIRIFSSPNGAYREVELDLPATDYELLDAMEQLRLEDGKRPYLESHAAEEYDYLNKRIPETDAIPDAALELLDYAQIGKNHREAEGSTFTGFGYVERHSELRQVYKSLDFTPKKPAYTILAETFDGSLVEFPFPANAPMGTEPVRCVDCAAPSLIGLNGGMEVVDLLARRLASLEPKALTAYRALLEATDCEDLQSAELLMDTLDEYIFFPQFSSPIEVAKGELSAILRAEDSERILPYLNLYQYGQSLIRDINGVMTGYGMLERKDREPIQSVTNQLQRGGMEMS